MKIKLILICLGFAIFGFGIGTIQADEITDLQESALMSQDSSMPPSELPQANNLSTLDSDSPTRVKGLVLLPIILYLLSALFRPEVTNELTTLFKEILTFRRYKRWGRLVSAETNLAVSLSKVELVDVVTGRVVARSVSGFGGGFGFKVYPGQYRLRAQKVGITFSLKKVPGYPNAYHNQIIDLRNWNDIPENLEIIGVSKTKPNPIFAGLWWLICFGILYLGGWIALRSIIGNFSLWAGITLLVYLIGLGFIIYKSVPRPRVTN